MVFVFALLIGRNFLALAGLVTWLVAWLLSWMVGCAGCYCEGRSSICLMWGQSVSYLVVQPGRRVVHTLLCIIFDQFCPQAV